MTANLTNLENFIVLVVSKRSKQFGQIARVVGLGVDGESERRLEFADGKRASYSNSRSFEEYYRYCGCNGNLSHEDRTEHETCKHFDKGISAIRERFCEMNRCTPSEFCRDYGRLFFKLK